MELCNLSEIRPLLEEHGFHFSKSMGQNFLIAPWVPQRIAEEAQLDEHSGVLEIGPGVGCLTKQLSLRAAKVAAVELDRRLPPVLAKTLADCDNVEIVSGDILKTEVLPFVQEHFPGLTPRVCANLPYNITTDILTHLIDAHCFSSIPVMVQREFARRMCSTAGSGDYGAFSVYANYHMEPRLLFDVPPSCFCPQPKVTSSVVSLTARPRDYWKVEDEKMFFRVVRGAFLQRRKTLVNSLASAFAGQLNKEQISNALRVCHLDNTVRGETLDIPGFATLAEALKKEMEAAK